MVPQSPLHRLQKMFCPLQQHRGHRIISSVEPCSPTLMMYQWVSRAGIKPALSRPLSARFLTLCHLLSPGLLRGFPATHRGAWSTWIFVSWLPPD